MIDNIGHVFNLDGIDVQIKRESYLAIYPYRRQVTRFIAQPTKRAQNTRAYRDVRRTLGDDWITDLTNSDNLIGALMSAGLDDDTIYGHIVSQAT